MIIISLTITSVPFI